MKRFQRRHALEPDGVLGLGTIAALNVPVASRVRQIELALERERWLPEMRREPHVFVNVSLFRLWAFDPDRPDEPLRMNVVVGKTLGHKTPIFVDHMEYVVFRPYWNPPPSIIRSEIVPKARRDPSYLDRQNMEIVASGAEGAPALPATPANLDQVVAGQALRAPEAGGEELARPRQVHLPELRQRLHARHSRAVALRAGPPGLQPRLHPARGPRRPRRVGAARPAGVDAAKGSRPR